MTKTEFNINGFPVEGVKHVDFDVEKGCFVLVYEDGSFQEIFVAENLDAFKNAST